MNIKKVENSEYKSASDLIKELLQDHPDLNEKIQTIIDRMQDEAQYSEMEKEYSQRMYSILTGLFNAFYDLENEKLHESEKAIIFWCSLKQFSSSWTKLLEDMK